MWIFTIYGMFSASAKNRHKKEITVRARSIRHLCNLRSKFKDIWPASARLMATPRADYGYRTVLPVDVWGTIVRRLAEEQTWSNFKDEAKAECDRYDPDYIDALHRVWVEMAFYQRARTSAGKKKMSIEY